MIRSKDRKQSVENYLEAIFTIENRCGSARVKDIAFALRLQKGSVSGALHGLKADGFVEHTPYRAVTLTVEGRRQALRVVRRNRIVARFLMEVLGLDTDYSRRAAHRMGSAVERRVVERMQASWPVTADRLFVRTDTMQP